MPNIRKAAAYTHQALLDLASQRLGVPKSELSVKDGIVSGGGKKISYGDLVKGQQLNLTIPVSGTLTDIRGLTIEGNPPMKPVSQYTIIGKSFRNTITASKVAAHETWATDVRLPGMLHARMVHPKTLGSTLVSAGELDKTRFPNAQVVVKGNLVGVVAPTEWEAIRAAQQVASATKWTDWKGLPGSANLHRYLKEAPTGNPRRCPRAIRTAATWRPRWRQPVKSLRPHMSFLHEACADRADHGRGRCSSRRRGAHLRAQPESPGAARRNCDDAGYFHRSRRGARVTRARPLRQVQRRKRGRGRRSGHSVASRRSACPRAVDAGRGLAMVHAVAGRLLGRADRTRR